MGNPARPNATLTKDPSEVDNKITTDESVLFSKTPTVTGDYPQTKEETPMGDRKIPKNETQMARNEANARKKPDSDKIDAKSNVNLGDRNNPIADTTAAENVLEHHTT